MTVLTQECEVVWLDAPHQMAFKTEQCETPGDTQLLCRTLYSAVSPGTELAAYRGDPPLRPGPIGPRVVGYCNVARVEACGSAVSNYSTGDLVLTLASHRSAYLVDQADVQAKLAADAPLAESACTYLFHLGYSALMEGGARAGSRVAVIGLGALGLGSVAVAAHAGCTVAAVSNQEASRQDASVLGAHEVLTRAQAGEIDGAEVDGYDLVILTTGRWDDWNIALRVAAPRATIAVLGFPGRDGRLPESNPFASEFFYAKQLSIKAVGIMPYGPDARHFLRFNQQRNMAYLSGLIAAGKLDASRLITEVRPARELETIYKSLDARERHYVTGVLDWTDV